MLVLSIHYTLPWNLSLYYSNLNTSIRIQTFVQLKLPTLILSHIMKITIIDWGNSGWVFISFASYETDRESKIIISCWLNKFAFLIKFNKWLVMWPSFNFRGKNLISILNSHSAIKFDFHFNRLYFDLVSI